MQITLLRCWSLGLFFLLLLSFYATFNRLDHHVHSHTRQDAKTGSVTSTPSHTSHTQLHGESQGIEQGHGNAPDAVFAFATGYSSAVYKRFCGTLRRAGFVGEVLIAVSPSLLERADMLAYFKEMRITALPVTTPDDQDASVFRVGVYQKWLESQEFHRVLVSDSRDVYFQDDPFRDLPDMHEPEVQFFTEHESKRFFKESINTGWVTSCFEYGEVRRLLYDKPVFCSGTILG